jgi:hypothetical protein
MKTDSVMLDIRMRQTQRIQPALFEQFPSQYARLYATKPRSHEDTKAIRRIEDDTIRRPGQRSRPELQGVNRTRRARQPIPSARLDRITP